jgi:hypothetical protein
LTAAAGRVTHFVSAAYFTKPGADPAAAARQIEAAIRPGDEVGLHLHMWRSLVESSGVAARLAPSFLRPGGELLEFEDGDVGFEVDPGAYSTDELRRIIGRSRQLLGENGIELEPLFRAGGWLASPEVLEAARAEGFVVDSSSTDAAWLAGPENHDTRHLAERVARLWPAIDRTSQPYWIATAAGAVLEMPHTGNTADYLTVAEMNRHIEWALTEAKRARRPVFIQLGLHAETAQLYAPRLEQVFADLGDRRGELVLETVSRSARSARALAGEPPGPR